MRNTGFLGLLQILRRLGNFDSYALASNCSRCYFSVGLSFFYLAELFMAIFLTNRIKSDLKIP